MPNFLPDIKRVFWQDVHLSVLAVNPTLYQHIEALNPEKQLPLYLAHYRFGTYLMKHGQFQLPDDGSIQQALRYALPHSPLFLVLEKSVEKFLLVQERLVSLRLLQAGQLSGTDNLFANSSPYSTPEYMTAGARSLFMLSKIAEKIGHTRLQRRFHFLFDRPYDPRQHWKIFKAISNGHTEILPWKTTLLFFSENWFTYQTDPAWFDFFRYLACNHHHEEAYWRQHVAWDIALDSLNSTPMLLKEIHQRDYLRHLVAVATRALPGFIPAINDDCAPIALLQNTYLDTYQMASSPVLLQPGYLEKGGSVYQSLPYTNALTLAPSAKRKIHFLTEIYRLSTLFQKYQLAFQQLTLKAEIESLREAFEERIYDFFYPQAKGYRTLKNSHLVHEEDYRFLNFQCREHSLPFAGNSTFLKGCIKITNPAENH